MEYAIGECNEENWSKEAGVHVPAKRLSDALGDCFAARFLEAALVGGRLAHAYLLVGADESIKLDAARALAKAGNCQGEHHPGAYCDVCSSCRQIDAGHSANMRVFGISTALNKDIVDEFITYASIKAQAGCLKVSVLRDADFFTDVAADRVLKTIEEPIPGNVFLLFSKNSRRILPTIRSRVQLMKVERASDNPSIAPAPSVAPVEDDRIEILLEFARANMSLSEVVARLVRAGTPGNSRDNAIASLQTMALFMNGVLRARGKIAPPEGVSLATEPELARVNFVLDESQVWPFLNRLGERLKHAEQNVNPELVLTNALLELRRITTHE